MRFINQTINTLADQGDDLQLGLNLTQTSCIDVGLSIAVDEFLATDMDYLFSLDYDILFNPYGIPAQNGANVLRQLIAGCKETGGVVGAPYIRRGNKDQLCLVPLKAQCIEIGPKGGIIEVRYLPTGCSMIPRIVLEKVIEGKEKARYDTNTWIYPIFQPRPYMNHEGINVYLSHDYSFSQYVRDAGFKNYIDSRIVLGHMGQTVFAPG